VNTHSWNARNQLSGITGPTPSAFDYDGLGRRVRKNVNGTVTEFLYDGNNPVQELAPGITTNLLTGFGVDEYFARSDSAGMRTFLTDALGSTVALADPAGTLETQYTYQAFGATTVTGATTTNPFGWTGRELDGTGLQFLRARYYSPTLHRFISEDPLQYVYSNVSTKLNVAFDFSRKESAIYTAARIRGLLGFSASVAVASENPFSYANNSPLRFTDPLGLWYVDLNLSVGQFLGVTGGLMISSSGIYPYVGGGIMFGVSPVSGAVTFSWSDPSPGWNCGVQAQAGFAAQVGRSYGRKQESFEEFGFGWPPGFSGTCYYVW
jgi:RHS repeat-associated protein